MLRILERQGVILGGDLVRQLQVSPATLSRWVQACGDRVVRIGRTRGARYGLHDEVRGIGARWPIWEIDADGSAQHRGHLHWLHGPACFWEQASSSGQVFEGLPPFMADMAPQGYMGRLFPHRHAELELPGRLNDWSEHHILQAVVLRGEDLVGNLVIGEASMDRFLRLEPVELETADYPAISLDRIRQGAGSSAAGEFPKFAAFDGKQHLLVKFTAGDGSAMDRRWRDLLICEHLAAEVLHEAGLPSARSHPVMVETQLFLQVPRFDRIGHRGRRATLTLAAIDDAWFGLRDNWAAAAVRLHQCGWLDGADRDRILLLEAFGRRIFNNDRHFGNLAFFWQPGAAEPVLKLAPAYDMLPMALAPAANGMLPEGLPEPPLPASALLPVWQQAAELATKFWQRVAEDDRISVDFRSLGRRAQEICGDR